MNWDADLDFSPLATPDGKTLSTLADARDYVLKMKETPETHDAAGMLLKAAEFGGPYRFFARDATRRAIETAATAKPKKKKPGSRKAAG